MKLLYEDENWFLMSTLKLLTKITKNRTLEIIRRIQAAKLSGSDKNSIGSIKSLVDIHAVGHRVVHGGEKFQQSVFIDENVIEGIEECIDLAPLHNPANLNGILAIKELLGGVAQVAVFDTAFHATMPPKSYLYAIPYQYYRRYKVRRYGFHGTSHRYIGYRYPR